MSDPLKTTYDVLADAADVMALTSTRIYPLVAPQGVTGPYITLMVLGDEPDNHLRGSGGLDACQVIATAWAETYAQAIAIANAVRTAMESAGYLSQSRGGDQFDPETDPDPGFYHIERQFLLWL